MASLKRVLDLAKTCIRSGQNVYLHGQPGVGKTEGIKALVASLTSRDVAPHLGPKDEGEKPVRCVLLSATTMETVDVRGLPTIQDGRTVWVPPSFVPLDNEDGGEPCIVFIDEFAQADEPVQIAIQKFIDRDLDCVEVSRRAVFVLASNRIEDNSGVKSIPQHIRRRFSHFTVECDSAEWCRWAEDNDVLPLVIDFIEAHPAALNTFNAESDDYAYATPASVTALSKVLAASAESDWFDLAVARCGVKFAADFQQFIALAAKCPNVQELLVNIDKREIPSEMGLQRLVLSGSIRLLREDATLFPNVVKLIEKVEAGKYKEFAAAALQTLVVLQREGVLGDVKVISNPRVMALFAKVAPLVSA